MPANKDPGQGHFVVSIIKSGFRIAAGALLFWAGMEIPNELISWGGVALVVAEVLGIVEELV